MGILSPWFEARRKHLSRVAGRRAFDSYLRYGRVSEVYAELVEVTGSEQKFYDFLSPALSHKALGNDRQALRRVLLYHVAEGRYPAARVANKRSIPSASAALASSRPTCGGVERCDPRPTRPGC